MDLLAQQRIDELSALNQWIGIHTNNGPVGILTGKNGDMDTIGSAIALATTHEHLMACGMHLGRMAKKMVQLHKAPFRKLSDTFTSWPKNLAGLIIVDAAAEEQTGLSLPSVPKCIIDHHATSTWELGNDDLYVNWNVNATTELISQYLITYAPDMMNSVVCQFLLAGLITDTGRFKHAKSHSFEVASELIERGEIDYQQFIEFIEHDPMTKSEQGTLLKGLNRSELIDVGEWCLCVTSCGTLEGRVASLLLQLDCDVSLVIRHRQGDTRLTARAPRRSTLMGVHLGEMMASIAQKLGGDGGGHDGAAGWNGQCDPVAAKSAFIDELARRRRLNE